MHRKDIYLRTAALGLKASRLRNHLVNGSSQGARRECLT